MMMMSLLWAAANFQAKPGGCKGSRFLHPTLLTHIFKRPIDFPSHQKSDKGVQNQNTSI